MEVSPMRTLARVEVGGVNASTQTGKAEALAREGRVLARMGGVCAAGGTAVLVASLAPHGDLPTHVSLEAAAQFIAQHQSWYVIHLWTLVTPLVWLCAFAALAGLVADGAARAVGRLLVPCAGIGATFSILTYSVDGFVFKMLADSWAAASGSERAELLLILNVMLKLLNGPFRVEILVWYGLTFFLAGLVVSLERRFPRWLGLIGAAAGAAGCVSGMVSLAGIELAVAGIGLPLDRLVFLLALPIEGIWMGMLGVLMWRRSHRIRVAATQTA